MSGNNNFYIQMSCDHESSVKNSNPGVVLRDPLYQASLGQPVNQTYWPRGELDLKDASQELPRLTDTSSSLSSLGALHLQQRPSTAWDAAVAATNLTARSAERRCQAAAALSGLQEPQSQSQQQRLQQPDQVPAPDMSS